MPMRYHMLFGLLVPVIACGSNDSNHGEGTGGQSGSSTGGSGGSSQPTSGTGGSVTTGGTTSPGGGMSTSGGSSMSGGNAGGNVTSMGGGGATGDGGSGNAGGENGGAGNAGGTTASGGAGGNTSGGAVSTSNSVLERNNNPSRDGHFVRPAISRAKVANMAPDTGFKATFKGGMFASPLYVEKGPGGKPVFIAAAITNDVYALDATTGDTVWSKNVGSAPSKSGASGAFCGNISPIGILSTPVIDEQAGVIYTAGAIGTDTIQSHQIYALSLEDGALKPGYPIDVTKTPAGSLMMNPVQPYNQRSALSLVNGILYVAYGGHVGDCPVYHGWVTAVDTKDPTKVAAWATAGEGEAIWSAGGLASDGTSIFATTGNSTNGVSDRSKSDSEAVVRLTGMAQFERNNTNTYYPSTWRTMDSQDADMGATNPIIINLPGATPSKMVVAISKDGYMYLLDAANLGGSDGHKVKLKVTSRNAAMQIKSVPTAYPSGDGINIAFATDSDAACPAGGPTGGKMVMAVTVSPGSPPTAKVSWCAALSGDVTAPIATTTDGKSDSVVWYISSGKLVGVNGDTGAVLYTSSDTCSAVQRWTSPIAVGNRIVAGGNGHLCSWSTP